jgi:hypothetical protein
MPASLESLVHGQRPLRVLLVEDSPADAELIVAELERSGHPLVWKRVQTAKEMKAALAANGWDIVLSDYAMPSFSGPAALEVLKSTGCDVPFLIISGTVGEETAVASLRAGAQDFLTKNNLSRLLPAIQRELADVVARRERGQAQEALRHSEAQYRLLVDRAVFGIYRSTKDGRFLSVNPALVKMLRYESAEDLLATNLNEIYVDVSVRQTLLRRMEENGSITGAEVAWRQKSGAVIQVRYSGWKLESSDTGSCTFETIVEDITDHARLEAQLRQSQKMDAVGQLAGGIAHDFNNILTAILGYSNLVAERFAPGDPQRADIEEIHQAATRAAGLTRQLLAFSRKQIFEIHVLSLSEVVQEIAPMLHRLVDETIKVTTITKDRRRVKADRVQLQQVLLNLVVNARDAINGAGRITIETSDIELDAAYAREHPSAQPGPHVMLAVSDTGHGMDPATQARIFEPFFTTKPAGRGTGLGLSTVYGIVKQSGGHVWVYSEVGSGTALKVYLPATEEAVWMAPPRRTLEPGQTNATVLLVEDEEGLRKLVGRVLRKYGFTVHAPATPVEAVALASSRTIPFDLLLTDVVLPDITGRAVATTVLQHHPECKVLFMSGYTDDAIVRHGVLDEDAAFLQKPFTADALVQKIADVLAPASS